MDVGYLKVPGEAIVRMKLRFFAQAGSRTPYEFTVTGPMPSSLDEVTAMSHKL